MSAARAVRPLHLTKAERDAALARLRETFGGPPPEQMLRRARERARAAAPAPPKR